MDDEYTKTSMQKMLCCCRRRGTYTTTAVQPSYISEPKKKHVVKTTVTVPSQPTQEQSATPSRPVASNIPSVHHSTNTNSVDRTTSNQNGNTASVKTTQESNNHNIESISKVQNTNHVNSADNNRPTEGVNTEPVVQVQQTVNSTKLAENQNTEPVIKAQEINNSHNSGEKTRALDLGGTKPISVVQINTNPDNSGEKARTLEQVNTEPVIEVEKNTNTTHFGEKRSFEKDNTESVTKTEENIGHFTSADKSISQLSESSAFQDNSNQENPVEEAVVANNLNKEENKESDRTKQIIVSHQIIEDNSIPTPVTRTKLPQSNQSIDQTEVSISTAITQKANNQSDKAQANTDNILTGASIKLKRHQNEQLSKSEQENTTDRTKQVEEDDMKRSLRKIIPINVNNDDIKGPVPLIPRRSSLLRNISTEANIKEEPEDVEEPEQEEIPEISDDDDDGADVGQHKVTFGEVNEYYTQERREGIREAITVDTTMEIPKYPKSAEEITNLKEALASNEFLNNVLKGETLDLVIDSMYERYILESEVITQEGEPGRNMYVSDSGEYEIYVRKKLFDTFNDQRVFGELAILYDTKRKATIKAVTDGKVWVLQRDIYQQILVQCAIKDFEENLVFLKNVPLINKMNEESLKKVAHLLRREFFKTDTRIIQEGDTGDKFYIIRAGTVTVTKEGEGIVAELARGEFFGERALLRNFYRQANVLANSPGVECLTIMQSDFNDHFDERTLNPELYEEEENSIISTSEQIESIYLSADSYADVVLEDLEKKGILGIGGFGRVELVRHKSNENLTFALKVLKKGEVMERDQMEHVFNEKEVQMNCYCPFIVRLYKTFKDERYLYFLLESCLGGDLWTYLQKQKNRQVTEDDARFYTACVLEGLAYLHERNFVYRDLKPENMLVNSNGYIKLADFGFAKKLSTGDKTYTFNGTLEYLAPEIITNNGHDKAVDYWAMGIFIFEMLVGKAPFQTGETSSMQAFNSILKGIKSVQFPRHVSKNVANLIQKLCKAVPTERLGNQKGGAQDIRSHRWFRGFDWFALRKQQIKAPFVPDLESNIDTKYFGIFEEDTEDVPTELENFGDF